MSASLIYPIYKNSTQILPVLCAIQKKGDHVYKIKRNQSARVVNLSQSKNHQIKTYMNYHP